MKQRYHNLNKWIAGDDCCEVTSVVIESAHDPQNGDDERDLIISRYHTLIETGVTVTLIEVTYVCDPAKWGTKGREKQIVELSDPHTHPDVFENYITTLYSTNAAVEYLKVKVNISQELL